MRYHILKQENGEVKKWFTDIPTLDLARESLAALAIYEKSNDNKVNVYQWMVRVNHDKVVYSIAEG